LLELRGRPSDASRGRSRPCRAPSSARSLSLVPSRKPVSFTATAALCCIPLASPTETTNTLHSRICPLCAERGTHVVSTASPTLAGLQADAVNEVIMGNVISAGAGQAPARQAATGAGCLPSTVCTTVNKVRRVRAAWVWLADTSVPFGNSLASRTCCVLLPLHPLASLPHPPSTSSVCKYTWLVVQCGSLTLPCVSISLCRNVRCAHRG
jgi:hypothetical protein